MDIYGSQANLLADRYPQKQQYPQRRLAIVGKDAKRRRQDQMRSGNACLLFVGILMFTTVIVTTCIGAVYISHLQKHMRLVEERLIALESTSCICAKPDNAGNENSGEEGEEHEVAARSRRDTADVDEAHESEHQRLNHHGIASHNIALVYGDPQKIITNSGAVDKAHRFEKDVNSPEAAQCGTLYNRGDGQRWCTLGQNETYRLAPRYMTSKNNHEYYYFSKASWMNTTNSAKNYNLTSNGRIVVKHAGIYIVHASIHYTDVFKHDDPHYGVYKTDGLGFNRKLISKCVVSVSEVESDDASPATYPCQTWQLAHLKAGDQVFMNIGGYTWFEIEKETFHLALIKLNRHEL